MKYRPWGSVAWALSLSKQNRWHFVGAIGTEDRSLCSWAFLRGRGELSGEQIAEIQDVDCEKYGDRTRRAIGARRDEFHQHGGNVGAIQNLSLMAEMFKIAAFATQAEAAGESIVLDITSFPKRFFFTILRILAGSVRVRNLLITYTTAASYAEDAPLYENIDLWRTLPGFGGSAVGRELWIVSVGFLLRLV